VAIIFKWCPEQYKYRIQNKSASNVKSRMKLNSNKDSNETPSTTTSVSPAPASPESSPPPRKPRTTSQKKRTDITEITDNEVIHGDVTIAQTQATARLTQPCKLISNTATKNPDFPQHMSQHRPPHPLRPVQGKSIKMAATA
jgi:hypothetical protein